MDFKFERKETVILDPSNDMKQRAIPSEIRIDPLTGRTSRICHFMKLQWPLPDFQKMIEGSDKICPFCPGKVLKITPCFPPDILPEGRLTSEDMVLFPNIAPYDSLGAVATMGERHFIPMADIKAERIKKALKLAMTFFKRVNDAGHPESVYHIVNWNYMPPSGSSLIHAHLQVFASKSAPNLMREELERSHAYRAKTGNNFWKAFVDVEAKNEVRFIGNIGRTAWFSSFAPMGVAGDILAVVEGVHATLSLTENDLQDISTGLTRAMAAYEKMGIYSFNMNFFPGAEKDDHTLFHLVFSPRTFFNQALGTPDVGALRNLFNETLCMAYPEEIADHVRPFFQGNA